MSHEAAQKRVAQLEGALKAFGDAQGPSDDDPGVSRVCETCCAPLTAGLSMRAVHCMGARDVASIKSQTTMGLGVVRS